MFIAVYYNDDREAITSHNISGGSDSTFPRSPSVGRKIIQHLDQLNTNGLPSSDILPQVSLRKRVRLLFLPLMTLDDALNGIYSCE